MNERIKKRREREEEKVNREKRMKQKGEKTNGEREICEKRSIIIMEQSYVNLKFSKVNGKLYESGHIIYISEL